MIDTLPQLGTIFAGLGTAVGLGMAFAPEIAKRIGIRDRWTCKVSGRRFQDGWLVDAMHIDHDKSKPHYGYEWNGVIGCRTVHLENHIKQWLGFGYEDDYHAVRLLATRNYGYIDESGKVTAGLRTYLVYGENPELIYEDRLETCNTLRKYELDPADFIEHYEGVDAKD